MLLSSTRVIPILCFIFNGSLLDPQLRESNDVPASAKLALGLFRDGI